MDLKTTKHLKDLNLRDLGKHGTNTKTLDPVLQMLENTAPATSQADSPQFQPAQSAGARSTPPEQAETPGLVLPLDRGQEGATAPSPAPCSWHECSNGHRWGFSISNTGCPGCRAGIFGLMLRNCPACNEPPARTRLRIDYTTDKIGFAARCAGKHNPAETYYITIERTAEQSVEATNDEGMEEPAGGTGEVAAVEAN